MGVTNDQVYRCCCLCFNRRNVGASHVARAASSAGWHDHASGLRMRSGQDTSWGCLRGEDHQAPGPQVRSVGCRKRLPPLALRRHRPGREGCRRRPRRLLTSTAVCSEPAGVGSEFAANALELWTCGVTLNSLAAPRRLSYPGADSETGFPPRYRGPTGHLRPNR